MARTQKAHRDAWGSVRKLPSGRFQARYTTPDGSKRSLGSFDTKREARERLAREQVAITGGTWHDRDRGAVRLEDYIATWLRSRADLRDRTRALHERMLRVWIAGSHPLTSGDRPQVLNLGSRPVNSITASDVREWYSAVTAASQARATSRHSRKNTGPVAVNREIRAWARAQGLQVHSSGRIPDALRAGWEAAGGPVLLQLDPPPLNAGRTEAAQAYRLLKAAMTVAVKEGVTVSNPCTIRNGGDVKVAERVPATVREVAQIAAAMPDRYAAAVWVAAFSGLRHGELFALQRKHFDPTTNRIRVERALEHPGSTHRFGPPKSAAALRSVAIGEPALGHLLRHLTAHTPPGQDALIFGTSTGQPLYAGQIGKAFARAREAGGRPDLRWHDLRHTGATLAAQTGANLADIQVRIGHGSLDAARRYMHTSESRDDQIAQLMAERAALELAGVPAGR